MLKSLLLISCFAISFSAYCADPVEKSDFKFISENLTLDSVDSKKVEIHRFFIYSKTPLTRVFINGIEPIVYKSDSKEYPFLYQARQMHDATVKEFRLHAELSKHSEYVEVTAKKSGKSDELTIEALSILNKEQFEKVVDPFPLRKGKPVTNGSGDPTGFTDLVNAERAKRGLGKLAYDADLSKEAAKSNAMGGKNRGIRSGSSCWGTSGDVREAFEMFMRNSGTKQNLLNPRLRSMGIDVAENDTTVVGRE